ncbi:MAG: Gfo/Idh/MocA family oxidoreductase [Clostridia bacterium]|nr:Gfo/Idh/MocA family oxidoreductase [Clostridia bacterium]
MKYGIIGTGWITEEFIKGARDICSAEITAVFSRTDKSGKSYCERNNIKSYYNDFNEFAKADFDAVYIASPNALHFEQSFFMLQNGKHVICEKPICVNPEEYKTCLLEAEKRGLVYLEAIMYMHTPNKEKLFSALKKIGNITSAHFDFTQLSSKYSLYKRGETPNIFNPDLATGCLMDLGIYCVYPAVDIFGIPESLKSDSVFLRTGADGSGNASFNYGDKIVTLTYSKTGQNHSGSNIYGDKGTISIESVSKLINITLTDNNNNKEIICGDMIKSDIMGYEALDFEKFIGNPQDNKYGLCKKRSLQVSEIMEKMRKEAGIVFRTDKKQ